MLLIVYSSAIKEEINSWIAQSHKKSFNHQYYVTWCH